MSDIDDLIKALQTPQEERTAPIRDQDIIESIQSLQSDLKSAEQSYMQSLDLLSKIRSAAGDPTGKLMQPELVSKIGKTHRQSLSLKPRLERATSLLESAFGDLAEAYNHGFTSGTSRKRIVEFLDEEEQRMKPAEFILSNQEGDHPKESPET